MGYELVQRRRARSNPYRPFRAFLGMLLGVLLCQVVTVSPLYAEPSQEAQRFKIKAAPEEKVFLAGTFNGWSSTANPLAYDKETEEWQTSLPLEPGWYQYKFVVDGQWQEDPACKETVADGNGGYNSLRKVGEPPKAVRKRPTPDWNKLPVLTLPNQSEWQTLYEAAWSMALGHLAKGTPDNGYAPFYMDEAFSPMIYQWDSCFMALFALYGRDSIPPMAGLDNFYAKQREDGYMQRVYHESNGQPAVESPESDEPMINPPLFAWVEWLYLLRTGDKSRLETVLPILVRHFHWLDEHTRAMDESGLYRQTELGSGMDNTPRPEKPNGAWIDASAQMALAAKSIQALAEHAPEHDELAKEMAAHHKRIEQAINRHLWNEEREFYTDAEPGGRLKRTRHIGAYWTLLADLAPAARTSLLVAQLTRPETFQRPTPIPALAADEPDYSAEGHYWRGGVWAPTNYMVIRGLHHAGYHELAREIATKYLSVLSRVYHRFKPDTKKLDPAERFDDAYQTLWECYAPEAPAPATRWDAAFLSRQDFVGWTGLGPISLLIETILGLELAPLLEQVTWKVNSTIPFQLKQLPYGKHLLNLSYMEQGGGHLLTLESPVDLTLLLDNQGSLKSIPIEAGEKWQLLTQ